MKNEILDEDFNLEHSEKKGKNIASEAVGAVLAAAFIYFFILMLEIKWFNIVNPVYKAFFNDSLSIIHLLMAMIYLNYKITKGDYQKNIKGGYYILLFGSGFFFVGALISSIEGMMDSLSLKHSFNDFWKLNYQHLITLFVIFIKLILIRPIAFLLEKIKKDVPEKR